MAAVGKKDKCLLSGLFIRLAFLLHLVKNVTEFFMANISVLSDILVLLHFDALEALDELFVIVAECLEVCHTLEAVESAERRVVLI